MSGHHEPKEHRLASVRALRAFIRQQKAYMRFKVPLLVRDDTLKIEISRSQLNAFLNDHYEDSDPSPWHVIDIVRHMIYFDIH